jgi:cytochrome c-type biogenesis protein CcmE
MKKIFWIAIPLIIGGILVLVTASGDMATYSSFKDADNTESKVRIVGKLSKDKDLYYKPEVDPNYFSFFVTDMNGEERKVVLLGQKPQDFELSEQIVLTGKMEGSEFVATDMLLKCPSKYKDEELYFKQNS